MFTDAIPGSEILSQVRDVSASISLVQVRLGYLLSIHRTLFSAGKRDLAALILKDAVRLATENKLARGQPDMACHIVLVAIDSQFHDIAVEAAELMETVSRSACLKQASASAIGGQLDDRLAQMLPKEQASKDDPGDSIPVLKTNGKLPRAKAESCAVRLRELARSEDPAYQINGLIALTECCQPPGRVLSPEEIQALSEIEVE